MADGGERTGHRGYGHAQRTTVDAVLHSVPWILIDHFDIWNTLQYNAQFNHIIDIQDSVQRALHSIRIVSTRVLYQSTMTPS